MKFSKTPLLGSYLIDLDIKSDDRGFFARYFCENEFREQGLNTKWVQINNSHSIKRGTLRGLHIQNHPKSEIKLVRCIQGSIWDVIVDVRKNSNTFGKWFGAEITAANRTMMYVPKGFAHGFITLEPNTEIIYLVSEFYSISDEKTIIWSDQNLDIKWPIKPCVISEKDLQGKYFNDKIYEA
jgi:dTDP-4-dehydrorhamnose 3,5-epimerase